jgi:hypothetical protein
MGAMMIKTILQLKHIPFRFMGLIVLLSVDMRLMRLSVGGLKRVLNLLSDVFVIAFVILTMFISGSERVHISWTIDEFLTISEMIIMDLIVFMGVVTEIEMSLSARRVVMSSIELGMFIITVMDMFMPVLMMLLTAISQSSCACMLMLPITPGMAIATVCSSGGMQTCSSTSIGMSPTIFMIPNMRAACPSA